MSTEQLQRWWMRLDRQNAAALKKQGYDAIVMVSSRNGKTVEVQLPTKSGKMDRRRRVAYTKPGT